MAKFNGKDIIFSPHVHIGGGGGDQPKLFVPVVTGGVNTISWANNPNNGGFDVTIEATVNGTPVTSPLTITQDMDGKILTITASADKFQSATTSRTLMYITGGMSVYSSPSNDDISISTSDASFVNASHQDVGVNGRIFILKDAQSGSYTTTDVLSVAYPPSGNSMAISVRGDVSNDAVTGFCRNPNTVGGTVLKQVTGTIVVENITKGISVTFTFNNSDVASISGASSLFSANDVVTFKINLS